EIILDEWYRPVTKAWRAAQIFPEFSAGNTTLSNPGGPGSVANPANLPEAYATGATDVNNKLASFSLRGPSPYGEVKPEISAPGVNIRSSVPGGVYEGGWNGTSMAGPHTAGLAALLLQAKPSLTVDQLEDVISKTATPLTDSQYRTSPNNGYGYGLIDALAAVNSVLN
ncbi:S8 family serine peptidase, partial [Paenibacillus sp. OT2-17]|uniref:S8 family serine peptidase n=1 Tax=Paenibacillus sp. OT2-17 TaxID=2691605 RepID=UPI001352C21D